jgi:Methyltransferase domain
MQAMLDLMHLPPQSRIIDLGGTEENWRLIDHDFHVTLVNLPGSHPPVSDPLHYSSIDGDACDLGALFEDNSFDAVFSNSVIEHVGDEERQARFAAETHRLAPAYWIQTPSTLSPIEPHTGIPFYWSLPHFLREAILSSWHRRFPGWVVMLRETRVLSRRRMQELFPDSRIYVERILGIEKSYTLYHPFTVPEDRSH